MNMVVRSKPSFFRDYFNGKYAISQWHKVCALFDYNDYLGRNVFW